MRSWALFICSRHREHLRGGSGKTIAFQVKGKRLVSSRVCLVVIESAADLVAQRRIVEKRTCFRQLLKLFPKQRIRLARFVLIGKHKSVADLAQFGIRYLAAFRQGFEELVGLGNAALPQIQLPQLDPIC